MISSQIIRGNQISFKDLSPEKMFCRANDWDNDLGVAGLSNVFKKKSVDKALVVSSQKQGKIAGMTIPFIGDEQIIILEEV